MAQALTAGARAPRRIAGLVILAALACGPVSADELIHRDGRSWRRH
jgi:hypothetical protein